MTDTDRDLDSDPLDDHRLPARTAPSCPNCGGHDNVEATEHSAGQWACSSCVSIFEGSQSEWDRPPRFGALSARDRRERIQGEKAAKAARQQQREPDATKREQLEHQHGGPDPCRRCGGIAPARNRSDEARAPVELAELPRASDDTAVTDLAPYAVVYRDDPHPGTPNRPDS